MTESIVNENMLTVKTPVKASKVKSKRGSSTKAKVPKKIAIHPPTAQMVNAAIRNLKERGGSSLVAIKKYIATTYKVDVEKLAPFIKKYLKNATDSGKLIRTKGQGASGSFKLAGGKSEGTEKKKAQKLKKLKVPGAKKVKVGKTKKSVSAKKVKTENKSESSVGNNPTTSPNKPKAAKKPKSPKKAAAKKPKSPKTKKTITKKVAPKKK